MDGDGWDDGLVCEDPPLVGQLVLAAAVASVAGGALLVAGAVASGLWVRSATWDRRHRGR